MDCDSYRRTFLDHDWTRQSLADALAVAEHMRDCAACRKAADEYDHVRKVLGNTDRDSDLRVGRRPRIGSFAGQPISGWFAVTAAVAPALLAGVVGWVIYVQMPRGEAPRPPGDAVAGQGAAPVAPSQPAPPQVAPAAPVWTAEDVHRGMQVFQEVSATFDGRTSWVALGDRSTDIGLDSGAVDSVGMDDGANFIATPKVPAANLKPQASSFKPLFLLRLLLYRGQEEKSRTDLVIVAGQNARMELPLEPGRILHYVIGTSLGEPPKLSLWTEVRSPHGGETVAVLATQMRPRSGDTLNAGRIMTTSGEYRLEVSFMEQTLPAGPSPANLSRHDSTTFGHARSPQAEKLGLKS